jgi:AcrR family transcriptional regulator
MVPAATLTGLLRWTSPTPRPELRRYSPAASAGCASNRCLSGLIPMLACQTALVHIPEQVISQRGYVSGRYTRERLMVTAERLFSERGVHGVSMREIGLAASQRNNNVIAYHFGDKAGLLGAIYAFRSQQINRRRLELIEALDRDGRGREVRLLLMALLQPHAETIEDPDNHFLGFLARLLLDEGSLAGEGARMADRNLSGHEMLRKRIEAQSCQLKPKEFGHRFDLLFNFAITAFAARKIGPTTRSVEHLLEEVTTIVACGLASPAIHLSPR